MSIIEMQLLLHTRTIVEQLAEDACSVASVFKLSFHLTFTRSVVLRYTDSSFIPFAGRLLSAT